MQIERTNLDALVVNQLPDGSRVLLDSQKERVFALNATAGAAWDACSAPTTLSQVTEQMQRLLDMPVTEELAEQAILELQEQNLVKTLGAPANASRRAFITKMGMAAIPLVVSLTVADQRAYAEKARSGCDWSHKGLPGDGGDGGDGGDNGWNHWQHGGDGDPKPDPIFPKGHDFSLK